MCILDFLYIFNRFLFKCNINLSFFFCKPNQENTMLLIFMEFITFFSQHFWNGVFKLGTLLAMVSSSTYNLENMVIAILGIFRKLPSLKICTHILQSSRCYLNSCSNMLTMQVDEILQWRLSVQSLEYLLFSHSSLFLLPFLQIFNILHMHLSLFSVSISEGLCCQTLLILYFIVNVLLWVFPKLIVIFLIELLSLVICESELVNIWLPIKYF